MIVHFCFASKGEGHKFFKDGQQGRRRTAANSCSSKIRNFVQSCLWGQSTGWKLKNSVKKKMIGSLHLDWTGNKLQKKGNCKKKIIKFKQFHSKIPSSDNFKKTTIFCNIPLYQIKLHINIHGSLEKILSQIFFARCMAFGLVFRKKEKNPNNFCVFCLNVWSSVL